MMLTFTKMHGLGNDFVLIDQMDHPVTLAKEHITFLANRRLGVGCDQVVVLQPSDDHHCVARMLIYNADGSQAEMCGNAARCVALYWVKHRQPHLTHMAITTLAGMVHLFPLADNRVTVDMGPPCLEGAQIPTTGQGVIKNYPLEIKGQLFAITAISMGNPHCVMLTDNSLAFPLEELGPAFVNHPFFPNRTNFEAMQIIDRSQARVRIYERGVGITPACGTGACASAIAGMLHDQLDRHVTIHLDGGPLEIAWRADQHVYMTGTATEVFQGSVPLP